MFNDFVHMMENHEIPQNFWLVKIRVEFGGLEKLCAYQFDMLHNFPSCQYIFCYRYAD